jgi:hypothetical protein
MTGTISTKRRPSNQKKQKKMLPVTPIRQIPVNGYLFVNTCDIRAIRVSLISAKSRHLSCFLALGPFDSFPDFTDSRKR